MTTELGSLTKSLYPKGSAMVGTVQQVAGAAGGAMLVALMSRIAAGVEADGGSHAQGIAAGTSVAFLVSAVLGVVTIAIRSEEHTSELQSRGHLVCRLLLE